MAHFHLPMMRDEAAGIFQYQKLPQCASKATNIIAKNSSNQKTCIHMDTKPITVSD